MQHVHFLTTAQTAVLGSGGRKRMSQIKKCCATCKFWEHGVCMRMGCPWLGVSVLAGHSCKFWKWRLDGGDL